MHASELDNTIAYLAAQIDRTGRDNLDHLLLQARRLRSRAVWELVRRTVRRLLLPVRARRGIVDSAAAYAGLSRDVAPLVRALRAGDSVPNVVPVPAPRRQLPTPWRHAA